MKKFKLIKELAAVSLLLCGATAQANKIGVDFQGRDPSTQPSPALAPADVAGVIPQSHWVGYFAGTGNETTDNSASPLPLTDDSGSVTPVTLTFNCNDAWHDDQTAPVASSTPDEKLTYGIIKVNSGSKPSGDGTFTFSHVPPGPSGYYDLYVYTLMNGGPVVLDSSLGDQYFHTTIAQTFAGTYIQGKNTDPSGTPDVGNYVKFTSVQPDAGGNIAVTLTHISGADGWGVAAIQLVADDVPPSVILTNVAATHDTVYLNFSEPLQDNATDLSHYAFTGGVTATAVTFADGAHTQLVIKTSAQTPGTSYTLTLTGVKDIPGNSTPTTVTFLSPAIQTNPIAGFGDAGGFTLNGGATISNGVATLTTRTNSEARSVFYNKLVDITHFNAQFTYHGSGNADGLAFVIQGDQRGATALGGAGGALGFATIQPAVGLLFNLYTGGGQPVGYAVSADGTTGTYTSTAPVNLASGHPIFVTLTYASANLHIKLVDGVSGDTFETDFAGDLQAALGGIQDAYVGFTGGTGGANSTQTVSDFVFSNAAITPPALAFSKQPVDVHSYTNLIAVFSAEANQPATYQWFRGSAAILGATNASLVLPSALASDNGVKFHVVATSGTSTATSQDASLIIDANIFVSGKIRWDFWSNIVDRAFIESSDAPAPSFTKYDVTIWDRPSDYSDNYTEKYSGQFIAPTTGDYVFFICSDDDSDLFLSTNEDPANKMLIARETVWSNEHEWTISGGGSNLAEKRSDTYSPAGDGIPTTVFNGGAPGVIHLIAGQKYYMEQVHHEGGGGDEIEATFKLTSEDDPISSVASSGGDTSRITGSVVGIYVTSLPLEFAQIPTTQHGITNSSVTFSTAFNIPASIQWYKGATAIPNATNATLNVGPLTQADNNTAYHVVAVGPLNTLTSPDVNIIIDPVTFSTGYIRWDFWSNVTSRATIETPNPPAPSFSQYVTIWDRPSDYADNYTEKYSGLFLPPVTGDYVFFIASDDDSDLFLSTDEDPNHKVLIAQETAWSNEHEWTISGGGSSLPKKRSDSLLADGGLGVIFNGGTEGQIHLVAGQKYYMEQVHHEGGGGDEIEATFKLASEDDPVSSVASAGGDTSRITGNVIGSYVLNGSYNVTITNQPVAVSTTANTKASFVVGVDNPNALVQWQSESSGATAFSDIAGATSSAYTTALLTTADSGTKFRAIVKVPGVTLTSAAAALTVGADTAAPTITSIYVENNHTIVLRFNEPLTAATAGTLANYLIDQGVTVSGVAVTSLPTEPGVVKLTTGTTLTQGSSYQVTVNGVTDLSGNATSNLKANASTTFSPGFVTYDLFRGISGVAIADLTGSSAYLANTPDVSGFLPGIDWTTNPGEDNYGLRLTGYITPETSGDYRFFVTSDDASQLFLSSDEDFANLSTAPIAEEPACCIAFREPLDDGTTPETSAPIALEAGKKYAFMALLKEGTGGDDIRVAMRKEGDTTPAAALTPLHGNLVGSFTTAAQSLTVVTNPVSQTVTNGGIATFTIAAGAVPTNAPISVQWQAEGSGGTAFTNIVGATGLTYSTSTTAASGTKYRAVITTLGNVSATTTEATLTVGNGGGAGSQLAIANNNNGTITITWDKAGTLQFTTDLKNTGTVWTNVSGTSPVTLPTAGSAQFFRVVGQ